MGAAQLNQPGGVGPLHAFEACSGSSTKRKHKLVEV